MEHTKLVIASVLKPVNDTRMYKKFAQSIGQAKKYDINIIGFYSKILPVDDNISFHPIFNFDRLSLKRLIVPIKYLNTLFKIKPEIIILETHELLIPTLLYKLVRNVRLYYDIRENYFLNIKHTNAFPGIIKYLVAYWVRLKEIASAPFIEFYFLAEKTYANELHFTKKKRIIIENKARSNAFKKDLNQKLDSQNLKIVFTGTIAETTGIYEAIDLHQKLIDKYPNCTLKIVGFCPHKKTYFDLLERLKSTKNIELVGGDKLVNHDDIWNAIDQADVGIIYYPPNVANDNSIPTKLYEYLAAHLPVITESKDHFRGLLEPYNAAVYCDFQGVNIERLINDLSTSIFYTKETNSEVFWEDEGLKLLEILKS